MKNYCTCKNLGNSRLENKLNWVIPEKIHTPTTEGMLENLTGGGVNGSGNPDGRGALNLKIHPQG